MSSVSSRILSITSTSFRYRVVWEQPYAVLNDDKDSDYYIGSKPVENSEKKKGTTIKKILQKIGLRKSEIPCVVPAKKRMVLDE